MDVLAGVIREALIVCAVLCLPVLVVATAVGTLVAIVQAATQVQEQTLTLLPKILAVCTMLVLFGAFGLRLCADLFMHAIVELPAIVRGGV